MNKVMIAAVVVSVMMSASAIADCFNDYDQIVNKLPMQVYTWRDSSPITLIQLTPDFPFSPTTDPTLCEANGNYDHVSVAWTVGEWSSTIFYDNVGGSTKNELNLKEKLFTKKFG